MTHEPTFEDDPRSFSRFVDRHMRAVLAVAVAVAGERALGEEIAQETFLLAWQQLRAGVRVERVSPWLCGIARNLGRNARRRRTRERPADGLEELPSSAPSPLDSALSREAAVELDRALAALPDEYRAPLVLFYWSDQSIQQVAEGLGLSEGATRQRLSRGRKQVHAQLERALVAARPGAALTAAVVAALALRPRPAAASAARSAGRAAWLKGSAAALAVAALAIATQAQRPTAERRSSVAMGARPSAVEPWAATPAVERGAPPATAGARAGGATPRSSAAAGSPGAATGVAWRPLWRRIDLDLGEADVYHVLRLLSEVSGVPIRVEGDISARVNVRFRDTPVVEALDEILLQAGAQRTELPALRVVRTPAAGDAALPEGAPVSIDLEEAELAQLLGPLGDALGVPLFAAREVGELRLSLHVAGVPAGRVLAELLRAQGLAVEPALAIEVRPELPAAP